MPTYTTIFIFPDYMQTRTGHDNTMDHWEAPTADQAVALARKTLAERHDANDPGDFYLVAVMAGSVDDLRVEPDSDRCREPEPDSDRCREPEPDSDRCREPEPDSDRCREPEPRATPGFRIVASALAHAIDRATAEIKALGATVAAVRAQLEMFTNQGEKR